MPMKETKRAAGALALVAAVVLGAACLAGQESQADGDKPGGSGVVAKVGDASITLEEVDREAMKAGIKPYQDLYDARRRALDEMIAKRLLESAAKARGTSVDELMNEETAKRVRTVTDENIDTFYARNKDRMGGRTLDEMRGQIRDYLQSLAANEASQSYLAELRAGAGVSVQLEPPRVEVTVAANDPAKGPASAAVTVVEYSDFQ
jgi:hypothetical protein